MSDSFLDHIPSHEQKRLKRMMSESAYEALRDKVKGPEDLKNEMEKSEQVAELHFALESEPKQKEKLQQKLEKDLRENPEKVLDHPEKLPADVRAKLKEGKFAVQIAPHPKTKMDAVVVLPEGNVQEKIPVKLSYQDACIAQLLNAPL